MPRTQANRQMAIETDLGPDELLLKRLTFSEEIGRMYRLVVELESENYEILADEILGTDVSVRLNLDDGQGGERYFHGLVSHFEQIQESGVVATYRAVIVPHLWLLTQTRDARIFKDRDALYVIEQILAVHGINFNSDGVSGASNYRVRPFCVQYDESDFDFIMRLMEKEGIYYWFSQENGSHTMNLADGPSAHDPCPGYSELPFYPGTSANFDEQRIMRANRSKIFQSHLYAVTHYNYASPDDDLAVAEDGTLSHRSSRVRVLDPMAGHQTAQEGAYYAQVLKEQHEARSDLYTFTTDARGLFVGGTFQLENHSRISNSMDLLILSESFTADSESFENDDGAAGGVSFASQVTAIDATVPFRLARRTPMPHMHPQTATVVAAGGDVDVDDEYVTCVVQFHWDHFGKSQSALMDASESDVSDGGDSCRIRVSQSWAGKDWGWVTVPHLGHEVIVEFMEGNPDRPVIIGRLYNGNNPPYLAAGQNTGKMVMRDHGGNLLTMEGGSGSQAIEMFSPTSNTRVTLGGATLHDGSTEASPTGAQGESMS